MCVCVCVCVCEAFLWKFESRPLLPPHKNFVICGVIFEFFKIQLDVYTIKRSENHIKYQLNSHL